MSNLGWAGVRGKIDDWARHREWREGLGVERKQEAGRTGRETVHVHLSVSDWKEQGEGAIK